MLRLKLALLAGLVLIVPACGGDTSVPAPLLSENFNGAFPGTTWTTPTTTGTTAPTFDVSGSMLRYEASVASSSASTTTTSSFTNPNVTFSLQMSATAAAGEEGVGTIEILNGTNVVVASMTWTPKNGTPVAYTLGGSAAGTSSPPSDGALNLFRFNVNSGGTATWTFNNTLVSTLPGFAAGPLKLRIGASSGTGTMWPEFVFDTITVTSP